MNNNTTSACYEPPLSSSPSDQRCPPQLRAIPLPVMTRSLSRTSSHTVASYSSTTELVPHVESKRDKRMSLSDKIKRWSWRPQKLPDSEANNLAGSDGGGDPPPSNARRKRIKAWQGWQFIFFGSWLNVFLLLIPISWILKLATTGSDTLVFTSCMLAMIPLVKLHDLAISVLSRRIGGSKTGLLNASFSNVVELVVAIIALRKCELRVVQSSLIGSILSKLLLILGMCFFAGGLVLITSVAATQIHSSLLSISVGAVCLPAAFHFALSYNEEDAAAVGTTLDQQKSDLLKMSHSVSFLLLFIYISYLLFQLWSHTHLYQDNCKPSDKLPVTASMRSVTGRVRRKSNNMRGRRSHSQASSFRSAQSSQSASVDFPQLACREEDKASPVEEAPETSYDLADDPLSAHPYGSRGATNEAVKRERRAYLLSPFGTTSQVTLSVNEFGVPRVDPTVRLVPAKERFRSGSDGSQRSRQSGASSSSSEDLSDDRECRRGSSRVSEVLSAYTTERGELVRAEKVEADLVKGRGAGADAVELRGRRNRAEDESSRFTSSPSTGHAEEEELEMSWVMIIALLTTVTVLVTIDAEWLVDSMDSLSPTLSKEWIGLILLPIVSSIAECVTAVNVSVKDQLTLSISVAVGSTIQTALFVIPSMVILGWILDKPLALLFDPFESVVLYISVHIMGCVVADGKSNWLEGVILISLYLVIAVTFWFYPGSNFSSTLAVCVDTAVIP